MANATQEFNYDTYKIGEKTYHKATFGPKTWSDISGKLPGQKVNFVDILFGKFEKELVASISTKR